MSGFSDIPTLSYLHTSIPRSHSANWLAAISTNPQQSSPQQALYNSLNQIQNLVADEICHPFISTAPISALRFILAAKTGKVRQRYNCIRKANDRNCTRVGT
jgi:hypothetical protein